MNPGRGWGPAGAFNWFHGNLANPTGAGGDFARLRVRPLMGGIAYTIGSGPVRWKADSIVPSAGVVYSLF